MRYPMKFMFFMDLFSIFILIVAGLGAVFYILIPALWRILS